jgi:hypothetical protein
MQLGKSLVGAVIGAAIGIGMLFVASMFMRLDGVWLSIPFAILTGLGVRMFAGTAGRASYLRGALTMLVALAAYIGGWTLVAKVAMAKATAQTTNPAAATEPAATTGDDAKEGESKEGESKDEAQVADAGPPAAAPKAAKGAMPIPPSSRTIGSNWDIIWLAISALVAYELGRGSGVTPADRPAPEQAPMGTHPDA